MKIYRYYEYTQYLTALSNYKREVIEKEKKPELKVEKVGNIIDIQA